MAYSATYVAADIATQAIDMVGLLSVQVVIFAPLIAIVLFVVWSSGRVRSFSGRV